MVIILFNKLKNIIPFKSPVFIISCIISFFQTTIGLFTDKYIFSQEVCPSVKYIIYRLALLFILTFIWYCVIRFIKKVKNKEKIYLCYLINFLFYFAVYSVVMLLIWPGHWVADEKGIIESAVTLSLYSWQHIFTSLFYNFSLMIFPSPVIIVVIQYTIISIIISFIVSNTYLKYKYGKKVLLLNIVFFLPSVIVNVFYPMRLILFAYLELLFFYLLYQNKDKKKFKNTTLLGLSVLNIVLAVWRTECLFMVIILPLFLFIKKVPGKKILAVFLLVISVSCSSVLLQNYFLKINGVKIKYSVTGIVRPFHKLLKEEYADNPKSQLISEISEYLNIEKAVSYERGIDAFWGSDVYKKVDSDEKYKTMLKNFLSLLKKYPQTFIEERLLTFSETMCHWEDNSKLAGVVRNGNLNLEVFNLNEYINGKPINIELRKNVLQFLYANTGNKAADFVFSLSYNLFIPLAFLFFLFIKSFIKRKRNWCCLIISGTLVIQNFLIFLTAPENFFMYYYPLVVCSYSLFALFVIKKTSKLKSHKFSFLTGGKNENKK